jgi:quinol monooxygenase YgiN
MICINVTYDCKPGMREAFYGAIRERGIDELCRNENGCRRYEYFNAIEKPDRLLLAEIWEDREVLAVHQKTAHFQVLQELKAQYVDSVDLSVMTK